MTAPSEWAQSEAAKVVVMPPEGTDDVTDMQRFIWRYLQKQVALALDAARAEGRREENEACAVVADDHARVCERDSKYLDRRGQEKAGERRLGALHIASAIRARMTQRCPHDWVDATNERVSNTDVCTKCHEIRPTPERARMTQETNDADD